MEYIKINPFTHLIINPLERKKVEFEFVYTTGGSLFEAPQDRGKKHLLEHCIASRTKEMGFQTLKDFSFRQNIDFNAYTSPEEMGLTAAGHHSDFKAIADIVLEMAFEPTFDQSILDREKEIVLREISERSGEPSYIVHYHTMREVFEPTSKSVHETLGSAELVAGTELSDFQKLQQQNLETGHLVLMVSGGGIDKNYLLDKLKSYTQNSKSREPKAVNYDYFPDVFKSDNVYRIVHPLAHQQVEMSIAIPLDMSPDRRAARSLFFHLFLNYGGVLYDRLRDEKSLIYGMHSYFDVKMGCLMIYMTCEIGQVETILENTQDIFTDFESYFQTQKMQDLKSSIYKKDDIAQDKPTYNTRFIFESLSNYGLPTSFQSFTESMLQTDKDDVQLVYDQISQNWQNKKLVLVSKDPTIQKLRV